MALPGFLQRLGLQRLGLGRFWALRQTTAMPYQRQSGEWHGKTAAGIYITPDRSLTHDAVWACHRYLTQTVGQLPVRVMRIRTDGSGAAERLPTNPIIHPTEYALQWRPNPEIGPFQFKETMVGWALMYGNGFAEIERDGAGRLANLWPLEPWRVRVMRDDQSGEIFYRVNNRGRGPVDLAARDVFHLRGFGNGPVGLSVIEYAAQSIGWAKATELFGATFFGEGMQFSGAVITQGRSSADSIRRQRAELEEQHKGVARSNRWVFFDNGTTIQKMSVAPNEAQFIETLQFQVETICRWFGVPPQKVQHMLRLTFNNVEQLAIEVVVDAITPWAIRFEEEATFKLFGANRGNLFVKLDLKGLLRGDFATRSTGLQIQRRNGVINANQWADIEDMPRIGPDGDKYIVEGNMTTLKQVGETPPPTPMPRPAAPEPPEPPEPSSAARALRVLADSLAPAYV